MKKAILFTLILFLFFIPVSALELGNVEQGENTASNIISLPSISIMEEEINPDEYIVGVGDKFLVEFLPEQSSMIIPVLPTGVLYIPGGPSIDVKGKILSQVYHDINSKDKAFIRISLYDIKKIRIPVVGAVKTPGIYSINANFRLTDLIKSVPLKYLSKDFEIHIQSDKDTNIINIYEFYLNGDKGNNPYLHSGETVYLPFADPDKECIEVFGPVMAKSFIPFIEGETLGDFYKRKIVLSDVMDYEKVVVIRDEKQYMIPIGEIDSFTLQAHDRVEFIALKKIMVSGHVNRPGTYEFIPGHTIIDYISMAGGTNYKGSNSSAVLIRNSKKFKNPKNMEIKRGDIILVNRSAEDIFIGEISILSFVSMLASIASTVITAFIAAGNL